MDDLSRSARGMCSSLLGSGLSCPGAWDAFHGHEYRAGGIWAVQFGGAGRSICGALLTPFAQSFETVQGCNVPRGIGG